MSLRKIIKRFHCALPAMETVKCRASFPNEEAAFKLLYLVLQNAAKKWTMPIPNWSRAMNQFAILYDGRLPMLGDNSLTQFS
jgi:transposase-like protein